MINNLSKKTLWLYLASAEGNLCKIGISTNPQKRMKALSKSQPHQVSLIKKWQGSRQLERNIHELLHAVRRHGEWFDIEPERAKALCESVVSGDYDFALLYEDYIIAEKDCDWPKIRLLDEELHELGFETEGRRIREATKALLNERRKQQ